MKKYLLLLPMVVSIAKGQLPETDIFIVDMKNENGKLTFSTPANITHRKGYDNQPYFMPDGKSLLFVAVPDTTQADIFRYDFSTKKISAVTNTKESEYSPMLSPDWKEITVVRVDTDGAQRMYSFPLSDNAKAKQIQGTDSIGYYCWMNDSSLAMFILGNSMTLQTLNPKNAARNLVASDIGRCMKLSGDKKKLFFVIKQNEDEWSVFSLDIATGEKKKIISALKGSEDFSLLPDESFLMGSKGKLYQYIPSKGETWNEVADFSGVLGDFYRISVDAKGNRIAMVAFTGQKP